MTKTLKSLPVRNFTTSNTEEFVTGRQLVGIVQPIAVMETVNGRAAFTGLEARSAAAVVTVGKAGEAAASGGFDVLPCFIGGKDASAAHGHGSELGGRNTTLSIPPELMDEGTLTVTVGGSVSGVIDFTGDEDTITVDLVAGQTYMITLRGTGATPVNDTFLTVTGPGATPVGTDDDGGTDLNSTITFQAAVTGTYTITAESFSNPGDPGLGEWTVDVRQRGADDAPGAPPSAVVHTIGSTTFNFIETSGDADTYQVTLTAGLVYSFQVAAGADYNTDYLAVPAGEVDTLIDIFDSNGVLIGTVDDIAFPDDISSAISILPETSGTYYVRVRGYSGQTGGYTLVSSSVALGDLDPLDAINWFSADNVTFDTVPAVPTAYVYFAAAGENFGETGDDGVTPATSLGWTAQQQAQIMTALEQYEHILGVDYVVTTNVAQATFRIFTTVSTQFGAYFYPQDPAYGTQQGIGAFNVNSGAFTTAASLDQGGYSFAVVLHEFGHAHGLAHPHDNGGGSDVLLGVTASTGSYGVYDLNQGIYTVMSYNDAWPLHPDGELAFSVATSGYGWSGSLSAFDIAVLQLRYGVHDYNTGDNTYVIDDADAVGTFYECIWDSGGTDTISYTGVRNATIDLTAATLDYSPTGGGVISYVRGVHGGFTIANGVVIENATSGNGADILIGNAVANVLTANGGNDIVIGREGDDTMYGGAGTDTFIFDGNIADYTITAIAGGYTVEDNNAADGDDGFDTIYDGEYFQFADAIFAVDPDPLNNDAPSISGLVAALTFNENVVNATPQLIDSNVDFQDDDSNFDGGTLTLSGGLAEDVLAIRNEGTGIGQIGVSGANVTYNGIVIGTFAGGTGGTTLTVTFNASATSLAIDALIQNLTYANTSQDPTLNRTLTLGVTDADGATLVGIGGTSQSYVEQTGASDPLAGLPVLDFNPTVAVVDVNNDGDRDLVIGTVAGGLRYFENNGAGYTEVTGVTNPFNLYDPTVPVGETPGTGAYSSPCTIDIDGDSDLDLVIGSNYGLFDTFQNNGNGTWTQLVAAANPLNGIQDPYFSDPTAIDYDGDGDIDIVAGSSFGDTYAIRNNGGGSWTFLTGGGRPFAGATFDVGAFSSITSGDVDFDGDLDLVVGEADGILNVFLNNGGGTFVAATPAQNPWNGIDFGAFSLPAFGDIDGDGDLDLIVGDDGGGDTRVWLNTTVVTPASPTIAITVNSQNDAPSGTDHTVLLAESPAPTAYVFTVADFGFGDVDGDSLMEVVINTLPGQGTLRLGAAAVTAGQVITAAQISGGQLNYTPDANESGETYASFTFSVRDNGGTANGGVNTDPTPNVMTISVAETNTPPRLTDLADSVTYDENVVNATPQLLDIDVTFTDLEGNFDGGTLTVTGLLAEDLVGINNEGTGAGQIGISGNTVTYGGVTIGTFSGGVGGTFTVSLNGNADSESVDALIENLTYGNTSDHPTASRTLTINVTDASGADLAFQSSFEFAGIGPDNPFDGLTNGGSYSYPTFLDVDGDGDVDMVSGGNTGALFYYRNDGGTFIEPPGSQNPFNGMDVGSFSAPAAIDLDNDGDLDLVVGNSAGQLIAVRNNAGPTWTLQVTTGNPFTGVVVGGGNFSAPAAGDIDGDGDVDLVVGRGDGTVITYLRTGATTFVLQAGASNPFSGVDVGSFANVSLFDADGDGDLDALIGNSAGSIIAYNNGGAFTVADPAINPFDGLFIGSGPQLGFADLDGDGDLDAVAGSEYGDFLTFENTTPDSSIVVNVTAQVDRVELYNTSNVLVDTFHDIQDAIDAALDGYRIVAPAGTYNEDLVIDVDVTIEGANVGVAGTGARGAETHIDGSVEVTASGVTIDGVEIVGTSTIGGFLVGIYLHGNGAADDFSLVNSVLDGPSGGPTVYAILTEQVANLNLGDNLITGYQNGVYLSGNDTSGSVHGNLFQGDGSGSGSGLQQGIFLETSHVILDGNTFDGIDGGSIFFNPHGPLSVDMRTIILNTIITDSGIERPIQVFASAETPNMIGTDFNEVFYDPNYGGALEVLGSLSFDGQGGNDHIYGNRFDDSLLGGAGSDQIFGDDGDDTLNGGAGNDLLDGQGDVDTAEFADDSLTFLDTPIAWFITSSEGFDVLQRTEIAVDGLGQRHLLVGATAFGTMQDAFDVAQDNDIVRLAAGLHSGTFTYANENLTVIAQPDAVLNARFDTATGFGITVFAADGADSIIGSGNNDALSGGGGNDSLNGGGGDDLLVGGDGDDSYIVDGLGDQVLEGFDEGRDVVYAAATFALGANSHVEVLSAASLTGTSPIGLSGNELTQEIYGNAGANLIRGGGGADLLFGLGGNDEYYIDDAAETVFEGAGEGNRDAIYTSVSYELAAGSHVEVLSAQSLLGTDPLALTGNALAQEIVGNAGANALRGGGGADVLAGLGGNDEYYVGDANEAVFEGNGQGRDVIYASTSYVLQAGSEVEVLSAASLAGTDAINLTGNDYSNEVYGNAGANVLDGGALADYLFGGAGADTFAFTSGIGGGNIDRIADFSVADDTIALDDAVFTALAPGALAPGAFVIGSAAADADDRIIYNSATGQLFYDADGNGAGAAVQFATLGTGLALTASDFTVI